MKFNPVISDHEVGVATYKAYLTGFLLSIIVTLTAYLIVVNNVIPGKWAAAIVIGALALTQFVIQMRLFLHLGEEARPRQKLFVFCFMLSVVLILVGGSIWIMYNLNYRMMTPSQINTYMQDQDGGL